MSAVATLEGSHGGDYEKFYGLGVGRRIGRRIFVLASEETKTIVNRVNRKPQIPFKVKDTMDQSVTLRVLRIRPKE
jgi:hypothetical protein